jgi:hypothetical protein
MSTAGATAIDAGDGASLTLVLSGSSTVKGGHFCPAIRASGGSATIRGEGRMDAVSIGGMGDPAAIGGVWGEDSGNVSILGGHGTAYNPGFAVSSVAEGSLCAFTGHDGGHDWPTGNTYEW